MISYMLKSNGEFRAAKPALKCSTCPLSDRRAKGCATKPVDYRGNSIDMHDRVVAGLERDQTMKEIANDSGYYLANYYDISNMIGDLWSMCPRSYSEFMDEEERLVFSEVIRIAKSYKLGIPVDGELTPIGFELVTLVDRISGWISETKRERAYKRQKEKAKRNN